MCVWDLCLVKYGTNCSCCDIREVLSVFAIMKIIGNNFRNILIFKKRNDLHALAVLTYFHKWKPLIC